MNVSGHMLIWTFFLVLVYGTCAPSFVRTFQLHSVYSNNHYSGTCMHILHVDTVTIMCRHVTSVIVAVH
jgi:hypothetical protein